MTSGTSRIPVPFSGEGAGTGELTWGQQGIWLTMGKTGRTMNIGGAMALPAGTPLAEMVAVLRYLVSRHQALRTRLAFGPDGTPRQVVSASGEATLEVLDLAAGEDPDEVAEALRVRYESVPFDHPVEWPIRMGVVRRSGELTHLVVQYCHLSVDGFGIEAAVRDLSSMDKSTATTTAPVAGHTPLELARRQQSPAGQRQSEKSLRYWEQLLRALPAQRFGESGDRREPRFWELVCRSRAMHLAMRLIADRTRSDPGHVLLAAYAVALARVTGRSPSVAQVLVNNRFRPGCAESVSHLTQPGLCVIDVADATFDEVVGRAWKAATGAYLHGYYDTYAHQALLARVARERGEELDISCFVNDRRGPAAITDEPLPTPEDVTAARALTTVHWGRRLPTYDGSFYLHVDPVPGAVELAVWADTHRLSPAEIEACGRELESVTVEAALDPAAPTGVTAATGTRLAV